YGANQPGGNTRSDDQGRFSYNKLAEGRVTIQANFPTNGVATFQTTAGNTNVTIRASRPGGNGPAEPVTITGKITDASGAAAAGVSIRVVPANGANQNVQTDAGGGYSVTWRPLNGIGGRQYSLIARDIAHKLAVCVDIDEETRTKDAQLQPAFAIA